MLNVKIFHSTLKLLIIVPPLISRPGVLLSRPGRGLISRPARLPLIFKRPFTPRAWLRSARNFGKTRFRRFPTFHFSTPQKMFWRFFFKNFGVYFLFKNPAFGGAKIFWASLADSSLKLIACSSFIFSLRALAKGKQGSLSFQTVNGRLPLEHSSDRSKLWENTQQLHASDDLQLSIFWCRKKNRLTISANNFSSESVFRHFR